MDAERTGQNSIDFDFDTGVCRVPVTGVLDLRAASDLRRRVLKALAEHPVAVIIDLERVIRVEGLAERVLPAITRLHDSAPILICSSARSECGQLIPGTKYRGAQILETEAAALAALAAATVAGPAAFHLHTAGDENSPAQARRMVRRAFKEWNIESLCPAAEVIISELVTNSVRHAKTDVEVTIAKGRRYLHLHVRDRSRVLPTLPAARTSRNGRHGMTLVDHFANGWGTTITPYGKTVWATLAIPVDRS